MTRLSVSNPGLFKNPTLGEATTNQFLDQVEAQVKEDRSARVEGREPRLVIAEERYPQFMASGSVSSDVQPKLSFKGEDELTSEDEPFSIEDYE